MSFVWFQMGHQCCGRSSWLYEVVLLSSLQQRERNRLRHSQGDRENCHPVSSKIGKRKDFSVLDIVLTDHVRIRLLGISYLIRKFGISIASQWCDLCKSFLQEAKWSYNKTNPRFKEYLNNGWISSSGHVILIHAYFLSSPSMRREEPESLEHYHDILRLPSMILRLTNDLGTSSVCIFFSSL